LLGPIATSGNIIRRSKPAGKRRRLTKVIATRA
jgi:hypothetical protein